MGVKETKHFNEIDNSQFERSVVRAINPKTGFSGVGEHVWTVGKGRKQAHASSQNIRETCSILTEYQNNEWGVGDKLMLIGKRLSVRGQTP